MRPSLLWCSVMMAWLTGCDSSTDQPPTGTSASTVPSRAGAVPAIGSSTPAATAAPRLAHAGRWQGSYRATRAKITVPKGAPDDTWADDDGTTASGTGTVDLTIDADGQVKGTAKGALGAMTIRGWLDGATLRAGLAPLDPTAAIAMSGVLVGTTKDQTIAAELRVSSQDAKLVRSASVKLTRP